jgi:hypothetical protein
MAAADVPGKTLGSDCAETANGIRVSKSQQIPNHLIFMRFFVISAGG